MSALALNHETTVRPITNKDGRQIFRLLETAWRVHTRMVWSSLKMRLTQLPGLLVEDQAGLRGFMLIEPHPPKTGVIIAAGLRDTWSVTPYLTLLLPKIEQLAREAALSSLTYVGYETWLMDVLPEFGFEVREQIILFERFGDGSPPDTAQPATLRLAHRDDLAAIRALDALAFDHLWHKPSAYFNEALAVAGSFVVAEMEGQIVGYEWCEMHEKRGHLTRLGIHPAYQGRGIGGQLLRRAIIDALHQGVNLITLNTQENNRRSQALYTRFGFVQTAHRVPVLGKDLG